MIARLTGILAETAADSAVIDVAGVGYLVHASARTLDAIGPVGGEVMLLTEMQVREDSMTLFGFGSAGEREGFRALTSVQGVGGRVALAILSTLDPAELAAAVSLRARARRRMRCRRSPTSASSPPKPRPRSPRRSTNLATAPRSMHWSGLRSRRARGADLHLGFEQQSLVPEPLARRTGRAAAGPQVKADPIDVVTTAPELCVKTGRRPMVGGHDDRVEGAHAFVDPAALRRLVDRVKV